MPHWTDYPPTQAGLVAALKHAFAMPSDETKLTFEELLAKLN